MKRATYTLCMTKQTAQFISTIGHPFLLLPVVLAWLTIRKVGFESSWPTLTAIAICIALMVVFLYLRKRKGLISNWDVSAQEERSSSIYRPILFLTGVVALVMYSLKQPFIGDTLFFGLLIAVCYAINARIKVSQHTVIAYYVSFLVLPVNWRIGLIFLGLAPLVGWSRIVLGRHQKNEVMLGTAVGILFGILHWYIFE